MLSITRCCSPALDWSANYGIKPWPQRFSQSNQIQAETNNAHLEMRCEACFFQNFIDLKRTLSSSGLMCSSLPFSGKPWDYTQANATKFISPRMKLDSRFSCGLSFYKSKIMLQSYLWTQGKNEKRNIELLHMHDTVMTWQSLKGITKEIQVHSYIRKLSGDIVWWWISRHQMTWKDAHLIRARNHHACISIESGDCLFTLEHYAVLCN